jgi:hypothetical protein
MSLVLNVEILGEYKNLAKATQGADNTISGLTDTFRRAGTAISNVLSGIGIGFAVAVASQVKPAIDAASDLGEAVNAVSVTFGDSADGILELGRNAATSLGLANVELLGIATQFSSFAYQIAGEGGDVVQVIQDISTRGADFASVFNIEVSEALSKFQSGLAGQSEPLRAYGIDLSAAAVNAYAVANGITDGSSAMTESEKVMARYGLLMEQTAVTQGDFANTSDSLANTQRIMNAEFENLRAEVGEALLPIMVELFTAIRDSLPDLEKLLDEVLKLIPAFVDFAKWALENKETILGVTAALVALNIAIKAGQAAYAAYKLVAGGIAAINTGIAASNTAIATSATAASAATSTLIARLRLLAGLVGVVGTVAAVLSIPSSSAQPGTVPSTSQQGDIPGLGANIAPPQTPSGIPGFGAPLPIPASPTRGGGTQVPMSTNVEININRGTVNAEDVANALNDSLASTGSNLRIR